MRHAHHRNISTDAVAVPSEGVVCVCLCKRNISNPSLHVYLKKKLSVFVKYF